MKKIVITNYNNGCLYDTSGKYPITSIVLQQIDQNTYTYRYHHLVEYRTCPLISYPYPCSPKCPHQDKGCDKFNLIANAESLDELLELLNLSQKKDFLSIIITDEKGCVVYKKEAENECMAGKSSCRTCSYAPC